MTILLGIIVGGVVTYFILRPQLKKVIFKNKEVEYINALAEARNQRLEKEYSSLITQKDIIQSEIREKQKRIDDFNTTLERQIEIERYALNEAKEECFEEYQKIMAEQAAHFSKETKTFLTEIAEVQEKLDTEKNRLQAIIKETTEEKQKITSFNIPLTEQAKADIKRLREIRELIFEKDTVSKIIWKGYIEKPLSKMLKMFPKSAEITGIYKLTCGPTGEIYIGQAVNIADRFKQHIKKGLGIEITKTKLYDAMFAHGVENFTFEILEQCAADKLNQEEKYWIEFFNSKEYGLNTLGGIK